ncbi:MAG: NUDIX hydrolase [Granulosicoccaceae bacterium]
MSDKTLPWQTHSVETVYDNNWITVSHREVTAPTGNAAIYGLVHFKSVAVGMIPIDAEGYTWLVGQQRYTLDSYSWEIPEGGSAADEDPLLAAQRELQEETGITAANWAPLLRLHTSNSVTDESAIAYIAQGLTIGETQPDDTELIQLKHLPVQQAIEMVMDGEITDGLAMASLLKLQLLLQRGVINI